jgi:hypothetical protein
VSKGEFSLVASAVKIPGVANLSGSSPPSGGSLRRANLALMPGVLSRILSDRILKSARAQLVALVAPASLGVTGSAAEGVPEEGVPEVGSGKIGGDSVLAGRVVEGGRRSPEEVSLGVA